jgi:hypothetical protein
MNGPGFRSAGPKPSAMFPVNGFYRWTRFHRHASFVRDSSTAQVLIERQWSILRRTN